MTRTVRSGDSVAREYSGCDLKPLVDFIFSRSSTSFSFCHLLITDAQQFRHNIIEKKINKNFLMVLRYAHVDRDTKIRLKYS